MCLIHCFDDGCIHSTINCSDSNYCIIKCKGFGFYQCKGLNIIAKDINALSVKCAASGVRGYGCNNVDFEIINVNSVDIKCGRVLDGSNSFRGAVYNIKNVENLNVNCIGLGAWMFRIKFMFIQYILQLW